MTRSRPALLAVLLLATAAQPARAAVHPFRSIGPIDVGMTLTEVRAQLGEPAIARGGHLGFPDKGFEVDLVRGAVARIVTTSRDQRLPRRVGVGTAARSVPRRVPGATCVNARRSGVCSVTRGPLRRGRATRLVHRDGKVVSIIVERLTTDLVPVLPDGRRVLLGRSVQGRPITAVRYGNPDSSRKALVVAATHGDEPLSPVVARRLADRRIRGVDLWVIAVLNPDGLAAGRRQNAAGTDLNRNFSVGWRRGTPGDRFYPGPEPFSAPESRAIRDVTHLLRPAVTVWFHQPYGYVIPPIGGSTRVARKYARLCGYAVRTPAGPRSRGQAPTWQNAAYPTTTAFIVELPAAPLSGAALNRHVRATVAVAAERQRARPTQAGSRLTPAAS